MFYENILHFKISEDVLFIAIDQLYRDELIKENKDEWKITAKGLMFEGYENGKKKENNFNWATLAVIFGGVAAGFYYSAELLLKIWKAFLFFCQ